MNISELSGRQKAAILIVSLGVEASAKILKQLDPEFQLYVSPLNFDPLRPATPISHPARYATER